MDSMNSFEDLQALQQPSLGQALTMQPQQQQPMQAPQGPPATPEEYGQRVQGWTDTLSEMLANPAVSVALLQMGAALSAGRSAPEAMADTAGAVGRVGMMSEKYRQQQTLEEAARRKEGREDRRIGLEERELGAREKLWEMQAKNYERMARGGGGGGGGGGASTTKDITGRLDELTQMFYNRRMKEFQAKNRRDPTEAELGDLYTEASKDAEFAALGKTKIEPTFNPNTSGARPDLEAAKAILNSALPGSPEYNDALRTLQGYGGGGTAQPGASAPAMSPKDEAIARLQGLGMGQGQPQSRPQAQPQARPSNPALGDITQSQAVRGMPAERVAAALDNGTAQLWAQQGFDIKPLLQQIIGDQGYPPNTRAKAQAMLRTLP